MKGATSIPIIVAFSTVAAFFTGWNGWNSQKTLAVESDLSDAKIAINEKLGNQQTQISVNTSKIEALERGQDRFEAKMDELLRKNSIDPQRINDRFPVLTTVLATSSNEHP